MRTQASGLTLRFPHFAVCSWKILEAAEIRLLDPQDSYAVATDYGGWILLHSRASDFSRALAHVGWDLARVCLVFAYVSRVPFHEAFGQANFWFSEWEGDEASLGNRQIILLQWPDRLQTRIWESF